MIEMQDISVIYDNGVCALMDVNVKIGAGEFVFIVGPTGHGKTTFLKLIYADERPTKGKVFVDGTDITQLKPSRIPYLRRKIGVIFQDFRLLSQKTVWENVGFALRAIGMPRYELYRRIPKALGLVGLTHKIDCFPSQLSAGEQQKLCMARAIVNEPLILLADEPTGNLDPNSSWEIIKLLEEINRNGTTVIMATHNKSIVDEMRKRVIELSYGKILRDEKEGEYTRDT